jgi:outer membrane lipoprotein-sorting protein
MGRRTLLAAVVAALVVTSGCAALSSLGSDDPSPPDVDVAERYESLETVEATQVSSVEFDGETNETRTAVRIDLSSTPPRQFQRVLGPAERAGDVTVLNDSGLLRYDASNNSVSRIPRSSSTAALQDRSAFLASIVEAARDDEVAEPSDGVSPLPVVPSAGSTPAIPADAVDGFEVEYLGTDTIAGRTAHGFELTPASEAALSLNQTLWLDAEYYYPLKTHQVLDTDNRTFESERRLTNVTFNADLASDAFEFDVPEDATEESPDVSSESFDSVTDLRDATTLSVPSPAVPEGYEFERAQLFADNDTYVSLQYAADDGARLSVTKVDDVKNDSTVLESGENVTVAGNDGVFVTTGQTKLVTWACEETQFWITASNLDKDALLAVAESVACE